MRPARSRCRRRPMLGAAHLLARSGCRRGNAARPRSDRLEAGSVELACEPKGPNTSWHTSHPGLTTHLKLIDGDDNRRERGTFGNFVGACRMSDRLTSPTFGNGDFLALPSDPVVAVATLRLRNGEPRREGPPVPDREPAPVLDTESLDRLERALQSHGVPSAPPRGADYRYA